MSYSLDDEQQFWDGISLLHTLLISDGITDAPAELDDIVSTDCPSHALIDNALRSYLSFTTNYKGMHWPPSDG